MLRLIKLLYLQVEFVLVTERKSANTNLVLEGYLVRKVKSGYPKLPSNKKPRKDWITLYNAPLTQLNSHHQHNEVVIEILNEKSDA